MPVTAIELPYRLLLSPNEDGRWLHAIDPVTHDGRTELWHTRLAQRRTLIQGRTWIDEKNSTVRAIWTRDLDAGTPVDPFALSLSADRRRQLVRLTSDYSIQGYKPQPIQVERLMLSSLGAWLRSQATFQIPDQLSQSQGLTLEEWRHIATMGRDNYVRVVDKGFLYPFGHRAVKVEITERKFSAISTNSTTQAAYLRTRTFIVVRETEKVYSATGYARQGREMPFKSIQIKTLTTPQLDNPVDSLVVGDSQDSQQPKAFWIRVGKQNLPFHLIARDWEGQSSEFKAALIFVKGNITGQEIENIVRAKYLEGGRRCDLSGQKVAFAERLPNQTQDSTLNTKEFYFDTQRNNTIPYPHFLPKLDKAVVCIPAIEQLLGTNQVVTIQLYEKYLNNTPNAVQIFAKLVDSLSINNLSADKAGGLATLNMKINGLSQTLGPIAGNLDNLAGGSFNPAEILGDNKLLGCVALKDLVSSQFDAKQLPKMLSKTIAENGKPPYVETELSWNPAIESFRSLSVNPESSLTITARTRKQLGDSPPETQVYGKLRKFSIDFSGIIRVDFDSLEFNSQQGKKLDVNADIGGFEFQGALSFINDLRRYIPQDGFSDPPSLDVSPRGVDVGYSLGLPPIAIGVFSLQNINLSAGLFLPFNDEKARLSFAFSERHRPFLLSVLIFGGGGYFGIQTGLDSVLMMEGALEFGGVLALNLGVASGAIQAMAGIYFKLEGGGSELSGYFRIVGALQILGLICVSVEFYMALS